MEPSTLANDPFRRALRSLLQVGVIQGFMLLYNAFANVPLTASQMIAITTAATPILIFGQNLLEENGTIHAVWKAPASGSERKGA